MAEVDLWFKWPFNSLSMDIQYMHIATTITLRVCKATFKLASLSKMAH